MFKIAAALGLAATAAASDWTLVSKELGSDVSLTFAVGARDPEALEAAFNEFTRPGISSRRARYSHDEVTALAGNKAGVKLVERVLKAAGAQGISHTPGLDFVSATLSERAAEELLSADFALYEHSSGKQMVHTESHELPGALREHVLFVSKTSLPASPRPVHVEALSADGSVDPAVIRDVYDVDVDSCNGATSAGVFASLEQSFAPSDVADFSAAFDVPVQEFTVHGPNDPSACAGPDGFNDCGEATLDTEYLAGVALDLSEASFWSYPANKMGNEPFVAFMAELALTKSPPDVVSISYGDDERDVTEGQMIAFDQLAMRLGLQTVSVLASSGDDGAAGYYIRTDPDLACSYWVASFPASSPYVTAVGATQGPESGNPEIVCQSNEGGVVTSGGGFSTFYPTPDYQSDLVNAYLAGDDVPSTDLFNSSGRAYPDVSLLGYNYAVYINGTASGVSGTSASSPTFAALVSLINGQRVGDGKDPIGFLNTHLYSLAAEEGQTVFNDITAGMNNCGAGHDVSDLNCCETGFEAVEGYDPATGLGSVHFPSLREALQAV